MPSKYLTIPIILAVLFGAYFVHAQTINSIPTLDPWVTNGSVVQMRSALKGLQIQSLGSSGSPCLSVGLTGVVATTTCGSGSGTNYFTASGININQNTGSVIQGGSFSATSTTAISTFAGFAQVGTTTSQFGEDFAYHTTNNNAFFFDPRGVFAVSSNMIDGPQFEVDNPYSYSNSEPSATICLDSGGVCSNYMPPGQYTDLSPHAFFIGAGAFAYGSTTLFIGNFKTNATGVTNNNALTMDGNTGKLGLGLSYAQQSYPILPFPGKYDIDINSCNNPVSGTNIDIGDSQNNSWRVSCQGLISSMTMTATGTITGLSPIVTAGFRSAGYTLTAPSSFTNTITHDGVNYINDTVTYKLWSYTTVSTTTYYAVQQSPDTTVATDNTGFSFNVHLSWSSVPGATGYVLEIDDANGGDTWQDIGYVTSFFDNGGGNFDNTGNYTPPTTNATIAAFWTTSGNVGIGTSTPESPLTVIGTTTASCFSLIASPGTCITGGASSQWVTNGANIYYPNGNVGIGTSSPWASFSIANSVYTPNNPILVISSTTPTGATTTALEIEPNGNFLIGTSSDALNALSQINSPSPSQIPFIIREAVSPSTDQFDIYNQALTTKEAGISSAGTITTLGGLTVSIGPAQITGNSNGQLLMGNADTNATNNTLIEGSGGVNGALVLEGTSNANPASSSVSIVGGKNGISPVNMTFATNGNVSSGTTTPSTNWQFDIASSSAISPTTFKGQLALTDNSAGANLKHWVFTSEAGNLYVSPATDLYATSTTPAITATNAGNVGIGTSSPYAVLSVAGNTAATNFAANSNIASQFPYASSTGISLTGFSAGAILFSTSSGVISQDPTHFYYDNQNVGIGIGTASIFGGGIARALSISKTTATQPTNNSNESSVSYTINPPSDLNPFFSGAFAINENKSGSAPISSFLGMRALNVNVSNSGNGTNATVTDMVAVYANATGNGIATTTNSYDFVADSPNDVGAGPITNAYGVYIGAHQTTNVTKGWGIFQNGTLDSNRFRAAINTFDNPVTVTSATAASSLPYASSTSITASNTGFFGNTAIGTTTPTLPLSLNGGFAWQNAPTSGTSLDNVCLTNNGQVIVSTGGCTISTEVDKANIQPLAQGTLQKLMQLQPVTYELTPQALGDEAGDPNLSSEQVGLVAQQVQPIIPDLVTVDPTTLQPRTIRYDVLAVWVLQGLQEMYATFWTDIQSLFASRTADESTINSLQAEVGTLQSEVTQLQQSVNNAKPSPQ